MPFDPALPAQNAPVVSAELRDQFNGLKDLIDAQETRIAALEAALAGTALNPTTVGPFSTSLNDPPTAAQVQAILNVHNQLLGALLRP